MTMIPQETKQQEQRRRSSLDRMQLRNPLLKNEKNRSLYKVPLERLNCTFGTVTIQDDAYPLQKAVRRESNLKGADVTVLFAVRRPGCGNCREHGIQLSALAEQDRQIAVMGAVKETGVADEELINFYQHYFTHSIYKDPQWKVYKAMGGRRLSWPQLIFGFMRSEKRYACKKIENVKWGGDLHTQGGVLLFDAKGRLRFCYPEIYGKELDMDVLNEAIAAIRESQQDEASGKKESRKASMTSHTSIEGSEEDSSYEEEPKQQVTTREALHALRGQESKRKIESNSDDSVLQDADLNDIIETFPELSKEISEWIEPKGRLNPATPSGGAMDNPVAA